MRILLAFIAGLALSAQDSSTRIELGQTYQRSVPIGQIDIAHFRIVSPEQIVSIRIVPQTDDELLCRFYAPSGDLRRAFSTKVRENPTFTFIAGEAGDWRVEVSSSGPATAPARYVLSDLRFHPLTLAEPRPSVAFESQRLSVIHSPADVAAFWKEMSAVGTPLIETIPGEPDERLVTFVWRGSAETRSVYFASKWEIENRYLSQLRNTGIWYISVKIDRRVRASYRFAPNLPPPSRMASDAMQPLYQRDPLNPKIYGALPGDPDEPLHQGVSVVEMPDAPPQPWMIPHPDAPKGVVVARSFESKTFGNTRTVEVYTPPNFQISGKPYPLLVLFDGKDREGPMETAMVLDNLIAATRIPPLLAVMIHIIPGITEEARVQELGGGPALGDFLNTELIPWVRRQYNATADPHQTMIGGESLGGFAAAYAALLHPETFGIVIAQSASFYWPPLFTRGNERRIDFKADQNWIMQQFIKTPVLPVRFYIEAGSMERYHSGDGDGILLQARRMRDVLEARGYSVLYNEFYGAHDGVVWRETFAEALVRLFDASR